MAQTVPARESAPPGHDPAAPGGGASSAVADALDRSFKPVADPGGLGLAAFALTTFVLSFYNAGIVAESSEPVVFGLALAFGGGAQLLAGMWEFRTGNTFGATAFTAYGAFWLSFWAINVFYVEEIPESTLTTGLGLYLVAWGIFTAYMTIAAIRTTTAILTVFVLLTATFFLLGLGDLTGETQLNTIGGYVGIATALAAFYGSFATVTNATWGRTVIPVGHRGPS